MLTFEERQRIEAEEQRRAAEEQYRAQVRANLARPAGPSVNHIQRSNRRAWVFVAVALLAVGAYTFWNYAVPHTHLVPASQKIATGRVLVPANGFVPYRIDVTPDMVQPTLGGTFTASGLAGNDIVVAVIAGEDNYTNWTNRHEAQVLWQTSGPETTGNFSVRLRPGVNYLVVSNQISLLMNRQVALEATLHFQKEGM